MTSMLRLMAFETSDELFNLFFFKSFNCHYVCYNKKAFNSRLAILQFCFMISVRDKFKKKTDFVSLKMKVCIMSKLHCVLVHSIHTERDLVSRRNVFTESFHVLFTVLLLLIFCFEHFLSHLSSPFFFLHKMPSTHVSHGYSAFTLHYMCDSYVILCINF